MNLKYQIDLLESLIKNPSEGLPEDLFLFVSRITPLVNVDLLIKNENSQTLLTWRGDGFVKSGWHIPGGIVRFRETMSDRINVVAKKEPLAINELIHSQEDGSGTINVQII